MKKIIKIIYSQKSKKTFNKLGILKLDNKGFALTSIIYMLIVLFLMILLLVLSNLASRKIVLDKIKYDVKTKLDQEVIINASELPYLNTTTGIYYETLEQAFNNVQEGTENTIKVLKDVTDTSTPELAEGKNVVLDLNAYTISASNLITNNGTLDIYSSSNGGTIQSSAEKIIDNNGILTTNETSSSYILALTSTTTSSTARVIYNNSEGLATLNANTILSYDNSMSSEARYVVTNYGILTIAGATINNKVESTTYNRGIENGEKDSAGNNNSTATIIMTSGIIDTSGMCIRNHIVTTSSIQISGTSQLTSSNSSALYNSSTGEIVISGGIITTGSAAAINNNSTGEITVSGGTITGATYGIYNNSTGTITVSEGTITGTSGIYNKADGIINITGGTITGTTGQGVRGYTGTVSVGTNEATPSVSTTVPSITGETYGVQVTSGTINFYDGVIVGQNGSGSAISGTVNTPAGYTIVKTLTGTTETAVLGNS